jgi:hypothetical protein
MTMKLSQLAACALVGLAACTKYWDPAQEEAHIIAPGTFKAGSGEIYQVGVVHQKDRTLYRLFLRMDPPAGTQSVDVDRSIFMAGEFVELTNDGRVVRISGTSVNEALRRER